MTNDEAARVRIVPWLSTVGLSASALIAGGAFTAPICYWQGRLWSADRDGAVPMAWAREAAPVHWAMLGLAAVWTALWFVHARSVRRQALSTLHVIWPFAIFALAALYASATAYSCNIF